MIKFVLIGIIKGSVTVGVPGVGPGLAWPVARTYDVYDTRKECETAKRELLAGEPGRFYGADCREVRLSRPD